MTTVRPQTKQDIRATLDEKARLSTGQPLGEDQLEQLYNRLRDRGVIKYAPALGVYLTREPTPEDLNLGPKVDSP